MKDTARLFWLIAGILLGGGGVAYFLGQPRVAEAANDRFEDFVMCTGTVSINPRAPTDGVWLLDYKSGKLLATVIDRNMGKIVGWAEMDLTGEFGIPPRKECHFLMTTGQISQTQAALYVAETVSGKFGVYTLVSKPDGGFTIARHDLVMFRSPPPKP